VHCQHAGTGEKVLEYLGRYVHRVAIPNSRLEAFDGEHVDFRYRDNRTGEVRRCRLAALDFLGRFLQHVLPRHLVKVRSYGLYSSAARPSLQRAMDLLAERGDCIARKMPDDAAGRDERTCPRCGVGCMQLVAELLPIFSTNGPPSIRAPP
jgi:hypothetical protein